MLAPGASASFDLAFTPDGVRDFTAQVQVFFDDDTTADATVGLTGTGIQGRGSYYACGAARRRRHRADRLRAARARRPPAPRYSMTRSPRGSATTRRATMSCTATTASPSACRWMRAPPGTSTAVTAVPSVWTIGQ